MRRHGGKKRVALALFLLAAVLLATAPVLAANKQATVVAQSATVYAKPNASSRVLGTLSKGAKATVTAINGKIARIKYAGKSGYVKKAALKLEKEAASAKASATPTPSRSDSAASGGTTQKTLRNAVAYLEPSTACKKRTRVRRGTSFSILGETGDFYKVKRGGKLAYVPKSAFKTAAPSSTPTPAATVKPTPAATPAPAKVGSVNSSRAEKVISAALAQLGKRYVYGSTGPASFDCSGLTRYAYGQVGVSLAHSARSVGYDSGKQVSRSQLQRGDIVCFNTVSDGDLCDHVGIYLGGGKFVHASSGQGRVVISSLSGYYSQNFSWGRRVLSLPA